MSWIPDPPVILVLLKRIEQGENLLQDSCELFWRFYLQSLDPDQFKERTEFWINNQLEDSPKGGGFQDPKIRDYILSGPEKLSQVIIDKLDELSERKYVSYPPDEKEDPVALSIYLYIEASRLARFLKSEQYSERTRETLSNAINVLNRCKKAKESYLDVPWPEECSASLEAIGSFLYITQFCIQKSDGNYEEALDSLFWGFAHNIMARLLIPKYGYPNPKAIALISFINSIRDIWEDASWMQDLDPQEPVDCFEAIRNRSSDKNLKEIATKCSFFVTVSKEWWPDEEQEVEVKDAKGELWSVPGYWQRALAWAEDQLTPSDFKKIIDEREEQAAEKRLNKYFFGEVIWEKLPERSRRSLISADRDWFSGSIVRIEAILNELRIAVEEILIQFFWKPLVIWVEGSSRNQRGAQEFLDFKTELTNKGKMPNILDFEHICKMTITGAFLVNKEVPREDRVWFIQNLQKSLHPLRQARNRAEHESGSEFTHEEINRFYEEFIGIGQPGVIKQLYLLLNSINNNN